MIASCHGHFFIYQNRTLITLPRQNGFVGGDVTIRRISSTEFRKMINAKLRV